MEESFLKFEKWVSDLKSSDRVGVMCHSDADGLCSGVIILTGIEKLIGKKMRYVFFQDERAPTKALFNFVIKNKLTRLVVTDMGLGDNKKALLELTQKVKVLVIDHHVAKEIEVEGLTIIDSHKFKEWKYDPIRYIPSMIAYNFLSKIMDVTELDWMAVCGLIGDVSTDYWKLFVDKALKRNKLSMKQMELITSYINTAKVFSFEKVEETFWIIKDLSEPSGILKSKLKEDYEIVKREVERLKNEFEEKMEKYGRLYFYQINTKYNLISAIASTISFNIISPGDTVVIVGSSDNGKFYVSARNRKVTLFMDELLQEAVRGLDESQAGGHHIAAGCYFRKEDLPKFKEQLLRTYDEMTIRSQPR